MKLLKIGSFLQEVAETCYLRLNLVLLAIEARKYEGGEIWINPKNKKVSLKQVPMVPRCKAFGLLVYWSILLYWLIG